MNYYLCNQKGSVDDIRCHLQLISPATNEDAIRYIDYLEASIANEEQNKKRETVLKMLRQKVMKIKMMKF